MNPHSSRRVAARVLAPALLMLAWTASATAQTLNLTDSAATVLRGGSYANTNFSSDLVLATRASGDASYVRRVQLKFDTHNTIPLGTSIASATLTLTVAGGNSEARTLRAYRGPSSYNEQEATWNLRYTTTAWTTAGGDMAQIAGMATVTNAVGSRVTFDVTAMVQGIVSGTYGGSRYARFLILDSGGSSRDSYKEYYSDEAADATVRPTLTVTLGSVTTVAPEPEPAPTTTSTLKVLDWNIHHGVGTDGVYNIDRIATWIARSGAQIVSLNEVEKYTGWGNEDQPARFAALLKSKTGKTWYYNFASITGATNGQGNLLLSTLPIDSSADYLLSYTRSCAQIRVTVNGRTVNVFSTHLDADSSSRRTTQIGQVKSWAAAFPEGRVVAGDFNAWPGAAEITGMTSAHYDTWAVAKANGTAVAYAGNEAGNTRNSRIDYIFLSKGAATMVIKGSKVFDTRDANGVMPSDHRPVMTTFEVR